MSKIILIVFLEHFFLLAVEVPTGKFFKKTGSERYSIKINADNTFQQGVGGCLWTYLAKGRWSTRNDTVILTAEKIYDVHGTRKKKLQDTGSYLHRHFQRFDRLLFSGNDTVIQLFDFHDTILKIKLCRK